MQTKHLSDKKIGKKNIITQNINNNQIVTDYAVKKLIQQKNG